MRTGDGEIMTWTLAYPFSATVASVYDYDFVKATAAVRAFAARAVRSASPRTAAEMRKRMLTKRVPKLKKGR